MKTITCTYEIDVQGDLIVISCGFETTVYDKRALLNSSLAFDIKYAALELLKEV